MVRNKNAPHCSPGVCVMNRVQVLGGHTSLQSVLDPLWYTARV